MLPQPAENRRMRRIGLSLALLLALAVLAGLGWHFLIRPAALPPPPPSQEDGRLRVFVSLAPQAWLVERLGGAHVQVGVLVGPNQDPHTFTASPQQMAELARARLFFALGFPFEGELLAKLSATMTGLEVCDTTEGIERRRIEDAEDTRAEGEAAASHDDDRAGTADPHLWLSLRLAGRLAARMAEELARVDPAHTAEYAAKLQTLREELAAADGRCAVRLAPYRGRTFYVFHPSYGYFADDYGLQQRAIESSGKDPGPRELADLVARARRDGVKVIFVQPQFAPKAAETLAQELGARVVPLDPLAREYLANMEQIAAALAEAFAGEAVRAQFIAPADRPGENRAR
jgi:zinc transport system substrate-binding protein